LAKNLGFRVAKPDRHLRRIAGTLGFPSVDALCDSIAAHVGDSQAVVDLVFWRYATLFSDYLQRLTRDWDTDPGELLDDDAIPLAPNRG